MGRVHRTCLMIFAFCVVIASKAIAYSESQYYSWESSTSSGYSEVRDEVVFNQVLDIESLNVDFSQDDIYYVFTITGNSALNISDIYGTYTNQGMSGAVAPMLYKEENFGNGLKVLESGRRAFADFRNGHIYVTESVSRGSQSIYYYDDQFDAVNNIRQNETIQKSNLGGRFFLANSLRNSSSSSKYNYRNAKYYVSTYQSEGVGIESNNSRMQIDSTNRTCSFSFNTKIKINKDYIDDYRYLCFGTSYIVNYYYDSGLYLANSKGISVCTNTIDLGEYINCDHNWEYTIIDENEHRKYCDLCKWDRTENHNMEYEYDGMKNDICECSYINKVKCHFIINDDVISEVDEICDVNSVYTKHPYSTKTGYKFKWYDKYEKRIIDDSMLSTLSTAIREVFVATCSELDETINDRSIVYKAIYDPIKYKFIFSNTNNKNIELDGNVESQVVDYDTKFILNDNIECEGYAFDGWTLSEGSEQVDLKANQEIINYTVNDQEEYILYPVYSDLDFVIIYNAGNGKFSDGRSSKEIHYKYFDTMEFERPIADEGGAYFAYYIDGNGKIVKNIKDIKEYVDSNKLRGYSIDLTAVFGKSQYGSPEHTTDTDMAPGGKKDKIEETVIKDLLNETSAYNFITETNKPIIDERKSDGEKETREIKETDRKTLETNIIEESDEQEKSDIAKESVLKITNGRGYIYGMTNTALLKRLATKSTIVKKGKPSTKKPDAPQKNETANNRFAEITRYIGEHKVAFTIGTVTFIMVFGAYSVFVFRHLRNNEMV